MLLQDYKRLERRQAKQTTLKSSPGVWAEQIQSSADESLPMHELVDENKLIEVKIEKVENNEN